jgi:hypothetical protein
LSVVVMTQATRWAARLKVTRLSRIRRVPARASGGSDRVRRREPPPPLRADATRAGRSAGSSRAHTRAPMSTTTRPPSSRARMEPASPSIGGASTTTAGASIGASAMPHGVASMRASGRGARWRDRCLQPAMHRSPIGQVVRREAGRQVLLFSRDDHERHQRHRWHEGDE